MPFNISRQPLVPAFITLVALAAVAVVGMDIHPDFVSDFIGRTATGTTSGTIPGALFGTSSYFGSYATQSLAIDLPEKLLAQFQTAFPGWSKLIAGLLVLFAGMCTGRMTVRYNLYAVSTCITIPLYAIVACGLPAGNNYLGAFAASALLALSLKNYAAAFSNGYSFDAIFRASFYLGLLVLVLPAALPLLLLLPLAVLLFRRTFREAVVAGAGFLLPVALVCYVNWGAGGDFTAPVLSLGVACCMGTPLGLLSQLPIIILVLVTALVLLSLFAAVLFLSNRYNAGTKARLVLIFNIGILFITVLQLCGPAASASLFPLLAVPMAVLLPVFFLRIHRTIALTVYLILLGAAFCAAILQ